jgi:hypothetical protein
LAVVRDGSSWIPVPLAVMGADGTPAHTDAGSTASLGTHGPGYGSLPGFSQNTRRVKYRPGPDRAAGFSSAYPITRAPGIWTGPPRERADW